MRKKAIKFFAWYFGITEQSAKELNGMTIECMAKFAEQEVKNFGLRVRQPYTEKDLSEFAEWMGVNEWHYSINSDEWFTGKDVYKQGITTSQLQELWEIETGRREK